VEEIDELLRKRTQEFQKIIDYLGMSIMEGAPSDLFSESPFLLIRVLLVKVASCCNGRSSSSRVKNRETRTFEEMRRSFLYRSPVSPFIPFDLTSKILATFSPQRTPEQKQQQYPPSNRTTPPLRLAMSSTQRLWLDDGTPEEHYEFTVS
jgi:hypothetical protein